MKNIEILGIERHISYWWDWDSNWFAGNFTMNYLYNRCYYGYEDLQPLCVFK
jgi:hypothetical protein